MDRFHSSGGILLEAESQIKIQQVCNRDPTEYKGHGGYIYFMLWDCSASPASLPLLLTVLDTAPDWLPLGPVMPIPLAAYLPNFLLSRLKLNPFCHLLRLGLDILVDHVFYHLCIEDIICLRRTCKTLFLLTHEPIIWKRFLERMHVPIPPLRPTYRYSLQATDFEVEQLVTSAISCDDNWRKEWPKVYKKSVVLAHNMILDMVILPGGKFLVASTKDADNYRFSIVLFALDHPSGPRALARVPTSTKAYNLQAKYTVMNGKHGILIAYSQSYFVNKKPIGIDASDYSHRTQLDPPAPLQNGANSMFVSLASLEQLLDPEVQAYGSQYVSLLKCQPSPYQQVAVLDADREIGCFTLFEMQGEPYLAIVQQPETIAFVHLLSRNIMTLACWRMAPYQDREHRILAIRPLPAQQEIIIIRSAYLDDPTGQSDEQPYVVLIEMYAIPTQPGVTSAMPYIRSTLQSYNVDNVYISDYVPHSPHGDQPPLPRAFTVPPPISIFYRAKDPSVLIHHMLFPSLVEHPPHIPTPHPINYEYTLSNLFVQSKHYNDSYQMHVLPGVYRSLIYAVSPDDRTASPEVLHLRRYVSPESHPPDHLLPKIVDEETGGGPILRRPRAKLSGKNYTPFSEEQLEGSLKSWYGSGHGQAGSNSEEARDVLNAVNVAGGLAAVAWDESVGRLCIAGEQGGEINIVDFAQQVMPDARFRRWKRAQNILRTD